MLAVVRGFDGRDRCKVELEWGVVLIGVLPKRRESERGGRESGGMVRGISKL